MERYFVKMKPETPVLRNNYFIQTDDNLGWSSSIGSEDTDGESVLILHTQQCLI